MTDNEIIKALECCTADTTNNCKKLKCPMYKHCKKDLDALDKLALDLINRQKATIKEFDEKIVMQMGLIEHQKAEIENLNIELQAMRGAANSYKAENKILEAEVDTYVTLCKEIHDKVVMNVAERLKSKMTFDGISASHGKFNSAKFTDYEIDNLVKEMIQNGRK